MTPRALRAGPCSGAPPSAQAWGRETTPQRALRKMKDKAKRVAARAKKGKYPPIVVRTLANVTGRESPGTGAPKRNATADSSSTAGKGSDEFDRPSVCALCPRGVRIP